MSITGKDRSGVSLPPSWGWLDGIPDEWEPPEELLTPSSSIENNLAIKILSSELVGAKISEWTGRFVVEQSLLSAWLHQAKQGDAEMAMRLSGEALQQTRLVFEAWKPLEMLLSPHGGSSEGRNEVRQQAARLVDTLQQSVDALRAMRGVTS
ncbi:hypothetical protein J7E97_30660 [Streptomyces sp. ISL-66]|uniref:hypothetical protein n=1 Tax=Streptomyces sp. ISL-66 TaxID=2819186 RepID=UPI001BEAB9CF|nr:hypothetical protein [Streptomyces sp. ISL-66]MBT2472107.1 hypothetical protein [Streptomyces sp. ISL-66]